MLGFLGISLASWFVISLFAGAGVATYSAITGPKKARAAQRAAEEAAAAEAKRKRDWQAKQFQTELQAGEYFEELHTQQMELQAQASNINTLANLIESRRQPAQPQVFTLPPAKTHDPVTRINQAIDDLFRGK